MTLPEKDADRKALPIVTGVLDYFPDAIAAVAHCSKVGNDKHNPGQPLHWAKEKSTDQANTLARHLVQRGTFDTDGVRHAAKAAWRALALLQTEIEADGGRLYGPAQQKPAPVLLVDYMSTRPTNQALGLVVKYDDSEQQGTVTCYELRRSGDLKVVIRWDNGSSLKSGNPAALELVK